MKTHNFYTKNPWVLFSLNILFAMFSIILFANINFGIFLNKLFSHLPSFALMILLLVYVFLGLFLIQRISSKNVQVDIGDDEIMAVWQTGFFCKAEQQTIKKQEIIKWDISSSKMYSILKIWTPQKSYTLRAIAFFGPQKSFEILSEDFLKLVNG